MPKKAFIDMIDFAHKGNIYIYGTGGCATVLASVLNANGMDLKGYTYSPGFAPQVGASANLRSVCITELDLSANIIVGANIPHHSGIYSQLGAKGIKNVFPNTDLQYGYYEEMVEEISRQYCLLLCEAFEIDDDAFFKSEIITLKNIKLPNFYLDDSLTNIEKNVFLIEVADLLLPYGGGRCFSREGPYEVENCMFEKGDVVFDLGAAFGVVSAQAAARGCEVYAFEPSKYTMPYLERTIELYKGNIHAVPLAVSDVNALVDFMDTGAYGGNHIPSPEYLSSSDRARIRAVESTTIDDFLEKNSLNKIDYIKSDIEGSERNMLRGASRTLKAFAPKLSLCTYHYPDDKEVMKGLILEANSSYIVENNHCKLFAYSLYRR